MKFFYNKWFLLLLRLTLGGVFIYAGVLKIADPQAFADSIVTFSMLPKETINLLALTLPPFEILLGILLVGGWKLRSASFAIAILCFVFAVALVQAIIRGLEVDCGCFGGGDPSPLGVWLSLGRDLALFGISVWVYRVQHRKK